MERVLAELPMLQREVVYPKMFTGRTLEEIAEFLRGIAEHHLGPISVRDGQDAITFWDG